MIDIELNACNVLLSEVQEKGFAKVANPKNCIEKVKRRLNIILVETEYGTLKLSNQKQLTLF